jgi:transposase
LVLQEKRPAEIAEFTQLSLNCVYKRIRLLEEQGRTVVKRAGRKSIDQTDRISVVSEIVQSDNSLNLAGIKDSLFENGISLSKSAVCKLLKKASITRKRLKRITINSLSPNVVEQRAEYSRIFSRFDDSELIYLDELASTSIQVKYMDTRRVQWML